MLLCLDNVARAWRPHKRYGSSASMLRDVIPEFTFHFTPTYSLLG